jgi:hypothetical protein
LGFLDCPIERLDEISNPIDLEEEMVITVSSYYTWKEFREHYGSVPENIDENSNIYAYPLAELGKPLGDKFGLSLASQEASDLLKVNYPNFAFGYETLMDGKIWRDKNE